MVRGEGGGLGGGGGGGDLTKRDKEGKNTIRRGLR